MFRLSERLVWLDDTNEVLVMPWVIVWMKLGYVRVFILMMLVLYSARSCLVLILMLLCLKSSIFSFVNGRVIGVFVVVMGVFCGWLLCDLRVGVGWW